MKELDPVAEKEDPVQAFLALIEQDMRTHPERIQPLSAESLQRAKALVGHIEVDLEAGLMDDVSIE